jgi:DNA-binding IclR family transcriptional regulator
VSDRVTGQDLDVLRYVRRGASTDEVAAAVLGLPETNFGRQTRSEAARLLDGLERRGLVERQGRWRHRWRLTGSGRDAVAVSLLDLPDALLTEVRRNV